MGWAPPSTPAGAVSRSPGLCSGEAGSRGASVLKAGWTGAPLTWGVTWLACASWLGRGTGARSSLVVKFTTMSRISKATEPLTQGPSWDGARDNLRSIFHRDWQVCGATQACAVYNLHGCSQRPCCN